MSSGFQVIAGENVLNDYDASANGVVVDGVKVVGEQGSAITDASVAHALNATFSDTEVEAALNALGTKINTIIARLEAHGLIAS